MENEKKTNEEKIDFTPAKGKTIRHASEVEPSYWELCAIVNELQKRVETLEARQKEVA